VFPHDPPHYISQFQNSLGPSSLLLYHFVALQPRLGITETSGPCKIMTRGSENSICTQFPVPAPAPAITTTPHPPGPTTDASAANARHQLRRPQASAATHASRGAALDSAPGWSPPPSRYGAIHDPDLCRGPHGHPAPHRAPAVSCRCLPDHDHGRPSEMKPLLCTSY